VPKTPWGDNPDADSLLLLWAQSHTHREISHMLRDAIGLDVNERAVRNRLARLGFSNLAKPDWRRERDEDA